jgi:hypothetical protein
MTARVRLAGKSDDDLLNLRMCDLPIREDRPPLAARIRQLYRELDNRGLCFKPHVWLSSEWFSPDGVPGIAIPFYLAHPRLVQLERRQMLDVEGGTTESCMKILRHEAGHCFDTAYRLHFKKSWRDVFGPYSQKYPDSYKPRPTSRHHVQHLEMWYAQAHPAEDFAETFAVWLRGPQHWRQRYRGWPALRKLEYVDELMRSIADKPPPVRSRARIEPIHRIRITLREHYRKKRLYYMDDWPDFYDADLHKIFSSDRLHANRESAVRFLREMSPELRRIVSRWSGEHPYTIDQVLQDMIDRCRELRLRVPMSRNRAFVEAVAMLCVQTMNFIHSANHRVML